MLPQGLKVVTENTEVEMPSKTYKLDFEGRRIVGWIDSLEAILQAVRKILETERYAWEIYTQNYGVEFESLLGKNPDFVLTVLESRVQEALLADDRIQSVENFSVTQIPPESVVISCVVKTSQGSLEIREELNF